MIDKTRVSVLIIGLLVLQYTRPSIGYCSVYGLPDDVDNKGNIYFFQHNETSLVITLECRCALYTPQWILHEIGSEEFIASHDPVKCVKNGEDCSPVSYISASNAMSGYYLYQTSTFNVNQTTVLMCSSTNDKTAVVVSLKDTTDDQPMPVITMSPPIASVSPSLSTTSHLQSVTAHETSTKCSRMSSIITATVLMSSSLVTTSNIAIETPNISDGGELQSEVGVISTPTITLIGVVGVLLFTNILLLTFLLYVRTRHGKIIKGMHSISGSISSGINSVDTRATSQQNVCYNTLIEQEQSELSLSNV